MADLKGKLVQVGSTAVLKEANDMFTLLKNALSTAIGKNLSIGQSYMSKFEVADELRKRVKDKDKREFLDGNKTMKDILDDKKLTNNLTSYQALEIVLNNLKNEEYDPPLIGAWESVGKKNVYPIPNRIDKDPRRTGNLIIPGPADVMKGTEVRKWLINNSVLYGFVMYSDIGLYYLGVDSIKNAIKAATDKDAKLKSILTTFLKASENIDGLKLTGKAVVENTLPAPGPGDTGGPINTQTMFPDPGNLEYIPSHDLKDNNNRVLPLVVVDGKLVYKPVAFAVVALKKAALAQNVKIKVQSGFRPALGGSARSNKGTTYSPTSQLSIRSQRSHWKNRAGYKGNDNDFIYNAPSSFYSAEAAPVYASKHGFGIAIDFNTGGRTHFQASWNPTNYAWLIKNAHKFGFVRTVASEEWHFEYLPDKAKNGPYAGLAHKGGGKGGANKFYKDLQLAEGMFQY